MTMVLMAFIPLAMMAIAPWVVGLLYGETFLDAVAPFVILALFGLVRPVGLLAFSIPKGMGQPLVGAKAMGATAVMNVAFNAALIPPFGTVGAAVATTVSYVIGFSYLTVLAFRMTGATFPWSPVLRAVGSAVGAAAFMFALFLLWSGVDPAGPAWALIPPVLVVGLSGMAVYMLLLGGTRAVTVEDAEFVKGLRLPGSRFLASMIAIIAGLGSRR
jgi:O-antigen/teichoic acid export membrane protein